MVPAQTYEAKIERLETPRVATAALHGMPNCYKIKIKQASYRMVYRVEDLRITVVVVAVGKRGDVYKAANLQ